MPTIGVCPFVAGIAELVIPPPGLRPFPQLTLRLVLVIALVFTLGIGRLWLSGSLTWERSVIALGITLGLAWIVSEWILGQMARQRQSDRQQAEMMLHQSEANHRALISALPDLIMRVTGDGIYQEFIDTDVFKVIGKTGDFVGTHVEDSLPPELAARRMQAIRAALQTGDIQIYEQEILVDGAVQTEEVRVVVSGENEVLIIGRDVTARAQALAKLQQAKDAAEMANLAKNTFLATMSHELRTPLNAILGFVQILLRDRNTTPAQRNHLRIINRNAEHLLTLINDVLALTKIEANRMILEEHCFDLVALVDQVQETFYPRTQAKGLLLVCEYPPLGAPNSGLPQLVRGDSQKLRQVLTNLVDNAIKFTPQGSVTIRVSCQPDWNDPDFLMLTFVVDDTGLGIAPEEQATLFEPFVQTATGKASLQGSGLGLSICQSFVQLMGGTLTVESYPLQGSRFQFTVLMRRAQTVDLPLLRSPERILVGLAPNQLRYRILVVEALEDTQQFLVELLHPLGFTVEATRYGRQAIALCQTFAPHLVLLDMQLTDISSWEVIERIRTIEVMRIRSAELPTKIIGLSARVLGDQTIGSTAALDDLIEKPYSDVQLLEKIRQQLGAEYCYEAKVVAPDRATLLDPAQITLALGEMPLEWRQQLYAAAQAADEHTILDLLRSIPASQSHLVSTLTTLVDDFQLKQIIHAVKPTIL